MSNNIVFLDVIDDKYIEQKSKINENSNDGILEN